MVVVKIDGHYMQDVYHSAGANGDSHSGLRHLLAQVLKWGGALLSLALVLGIIFWAYRLGVRDARDIPVIQALDTPVRVQPDDPGGTVQPHQGLEVNEILAGNEAQSPQNAELAPATLDLVDEDQPIAAEAAVVVDTADEPEAALNDQADVDAQAAEILRQIANVPTASLRPRARPGNLPEIAPRTPGAGTVPIALEATEAEIVPGTRLIQLGAFDSEGQATSQWRELIGDHSDLLALKKKYIQRAESNGRIFYRLRVVGFEDANDQRTMCEALRARSVDCIPVTVR